MGLSNHQKYSLTIHAYQRYRERFNPNDSDEQIKSRVTGWLSQSEYLGKEQGNCQTWIHRKKGIICVVDIKAMQVVTMYKTMSEYNSNIIEEVAEFDEPISSELHPKAEQIVSGLVRDKYRSIKMSYYEKLGALHQEYGDRIDKLSRTTKPLMFKEKEAEALAIYKKIDELEQEFKEVMESLKYYILEGEETYE